MVKIIAGLFSVVALGAAAGEDSATVEIAKWQGNRRAAFQLAFDDGCRSHLDYAIPMLEKHRIPGTFYILGGWDSVASASNAWKSAAKSDFVELGNHTFVHGDIPDMKTLEAELKAANETIRAWTPGKKWPRLVSFGPTGGVKWSVPSNDVLRTLSRMNLNCRPAFFGPGYGIEANAAKCSEYVDKVIADGGLGHFDMHGVGGDWLKTDVGLFEEILRKLDAERDKLWLTTDALRVEYESQRDSANIEILTNNAERLVFKFTAKAHDRIFTCPLTFIVKDPSGASSAIVTRPDGSCDIVPVQDGKIIFDSPRGVVTVKFGASIVSRDIGDPEVNAWDAGTWVTCPGRIITLDERPDDPAAPKNAKALRFQIDYPARNFGGWHAILKKNMLPGRPVKIAGWTRKGTDKSWAMAFEFSDANTNKFKLYCTKPGKPREKFEITSNWQRFELIIPETVRGKGPNGKEMNMPIRFPVKLENVCQDNWGDRGNPNAVSRICDFYDLRLYTDMRGIAPEERGYEFLTIYPVVGNTFFYQEDPVEMTVAAGSWMGQERELSFDAKVISALGGETKLEIPTMKLVDGVSKKIKLPCTEPGGYTVEIKVKGLPEPIVSRSRYVVTLKPRELTEEEKEASIYGINVHGGGYVGYERFARLGFIWVRDYAFNFHWLNHARGDGKYAGWPWYPKIIKGAADVGMKTLPCLMHSILVKKGSKDPNDPTFTPSNEWRRQIALATSTFPELTAWELDNETDGTMWTSLDGYGRYCQAFGDILHAARPDAKAVSPGLAGIYVEQTRELVEKGYFRNIDAVNGHRYCGKDAPEYSKANLNTGMSEAKPAYLRDMWRHWKKAATCDGKFRELWVTEWGWDTLAGQPVTEIEQAAYLQRKWMLAMGNGVEKMFWYWYYDDDTDTPNYFFAGCGIFDRRRNPKPSAAAFAALRTFIPGKYEYLGTANLGPNHMVQIVRADGKIVAAAYKIKLDGPDLAIKDEKAELITDMFGRTLKPTGFMGKRKLDVAPTWYVGLDENSDWIRQCPLDLESDFYVRNVGGEPIKVEVTGPDKYEWSVQPPEGWQARRTEYGFDVIGPVGLKRGNTSFTVTGKNGKTVKTMSIEVDIVPQAYAKSHAALFNGEFTLDVTNQSAERQNFVVKAELPAGWKIEPMEVQTGEIAPEETKTLTFQLVESAPVDPAATGAANPKLSIVNDRGLQVDYAPVIPRRWQLRKLAAGKVTFDGDLGDWDEKYRVNSFMIGPNGDKDPTRIYMAWSEQGLAMALDVDDSRCFVADPGSFWRAADCFEVMLTTPEGVAFKEDQAWSKYDHQFWFCPLAEAKHMFAGFWANENEQRQIHKEINDRLNREGVKGVWQGAAAEADMKDVRSAVVKTERGYRAEFFVPAERFVGWNGMKTGAEIGLALTLVVEDWKNSQHELFWPNPKKEGAMKKPWTWAKVDLVD